MTVYVYDTEGAMTHLNAPLDARSRDSRFWTLAATRPAHWRTWDLNARGHETCTRLDQVEVGGGGLTMGPMVRW